MTREEIIRLAEEAGITVIGEAVWRLCEVVADVERANVTLAAFQVAERQIAAEREACAALVEQLLGENPDLSEVFIAAEIRARGQDE